MLAAKLTSYTTNALQANRTSLFFGNSNFSRNPESWQKKTGAWDWFSKIFGWLLFKLCLWPKEAKENEMLWLHQSATTSYTFVDIFWPMTWVSTYLWLKKKQVKTQRRFKDGPESRSTTPKMVATTSTTLHDLDLRLKTMLGEKFPQTVGF